MKTINQVRSEVLKETHRVFKARVNRKMILNDSREFAKLLRQIWKEHLREYNQYKWEEKIKAAKKRPSVNQISEIEMNNKRYDHERELAGRGFSID